MGNLLDTALWAAGVTLGGFVLFTAVSAAAAGGAPVLALGLIIGGLLLYWTWTERQETNSAAETAERVGDKASGFFGGVVDWFSAAVLSIGFVLLTVGGQFFDVVDVLVQAFTAAPITASTIGIGGVLAFLDWNGTVGLQFQEWVVIFVALTVVGVIGRRVLYGEVEY